ncbi:MAG: hypothetical protein FIA97_02635 [Methylococcaceae bacterium]|nr:hypothetical protein [Methylococcaceae bacterium]
MLTFPHNTDPPSKEKTMSNLTSRGSYAALLALVTLLAAGCTTLPNTSGYTAATIQVKQAVSTTGQVVESELLNAIEARAIKADESLAGQFHSTWNQTTHSLDAMVGYAQSVEQIVDAGNNGAESARRVADSVKQLADAVKVDPTTWAGGEAAKLSVDTLAFVYGEYSKFSAAKSLEEALDRSGPAMAKINGLVQAQVADAKRLFIEQIAAQAQELQSGGSGYGDWLKRKRENDAQTQIAVAALTKSLSAGDPENIARSKARIANTEAARAQIAPRVAEYESKFEQIRLRNNAGLSILGAAETAVATWGSTHQDLVYAIKHRQTVSVDSLILAVNEIRSLTQRWREL